MVSRVSYLVALGALLAAPSLAFGDDDHLPKRVGECVMTRISELGSRLQGVSDSGNSVSYENGGYGVSYSTVKELQRSRVGDRVKLCLVSIPEDCPPGDDRGKEYKATNLRTKGTWTLPDASHMCGGA
ncbi:hypothetical protein C5L14_14570 [Labrys okinawensis]|uniref:Secreted protein n=1 Tax=Labrys okinawensis TaxID=346911 RepID=A0A2S9QB33_9HYPH|nr:hypothetical protein C5L14_14570 [Labrys okinawensis]